jgi:hypothetical protein
MEKELVPVGQQPAQVTPMQLIARAQEANASIEQMQQLFDLQLRYEANEAKKAYNSAFAAFKSESVQIIKNITVSDGPLKGKKYADLFAVVNVITPALSKHGLSHMWSLTKDEKDWLEVTCTIRHELGHSESVSMGGPPDTGGAKNAIQARASSKSYLERYTLLGITGLASSGQDDDGAGAGKKQDVELISDRQHSDLLALIDEIKGDRAEKYKKGFCTYHKINDVADLPAAKYDAAVVTLERERGK